MSRNNNSNLAHRLLSKLSLYGLVSLCLVFMISLSSCEDKEEEKDALIGSWTLGNLVLFNCDDQNDNVSLSFDDSGCTDFLGDELCTTGVITFDEDGTFANTGSVLVNGTVISDFDDEGTWARNGTTVILCDLSGDCSGSTVIINGDDLTVSDGTSSGDCDRRREFDRM